MTRALWLISFPQADMLEPGVFRSYLQQWLPSYMVPQYFVELDAIPLLASGKVDRVGLANASIEVRKARATLPPRNEREAVIHRVWGDVLANDRFGVHDSFFDLGGHSLLAVRVAREDCARARSALRSPNVVQISDGRCACCGVGAGRGRARRRLVALRTEGDGPPVYCISGVELYEPLAERLAARFPVFGLFSQAEARYWSGADATGSSAVRDLAADYSAAIRRERPSGPMCSQGFPLVEWSRTSIAQQLRAIGADVPLLVVLDSDSANGGGQ